MKKKGAMKKENTKHRFAHEFAVLMVLVVSVGILFFYSSINFTGFAVFNEYENQTSCETAGYSWEELTEQNCTTVTTCANETIDCEPCIAFEDLNGTAGDCISWSECTNEVCADDEECETIVTGGQCVGDVCDASHLNLCLEETTCTGATGYWYDNVCNAEAQCVPATCDTDDCGSIDDGCGGTLECGTCEEDTTTTSSNDEESDNTPIPTTTFVAAPTCTSDWQCGEWQECIEGNQIRVCTDLNECGSEEGLPATSQACVVEVLETCSDKIMNQDETGIDCGGSVCKKCSIFTIVGSAVSGAINASTDFIFKGMFGNTTKTIISISVLVFIIGGAILGFFFLKKKGKLFPDKTSKPKSDNEDMGTSKLETY